MAIEAAAPVGSLIQLRRRWLATGFKSMNSVLRTMSDQHPDAQTVGNKSYNLHEFGEALRRVHVTEASEHIMLFNHLVSSRDPNGRLTVVELAAALATVSPHL